MGVLPILVFVVIIVAGVRLMGGVAAKAKTKPQRQEYIERYVEEGPVRTSWGYEFPADYDFKPEEVRSREQLLADLKRLLQATFREYRIYYQVPASALDSQAHPACAPIQFIFEKNGVYRLAVFVVVESTYRSMNVRGTWEICEAMGMKCIRFFEEYANDDDYVVARIRHYLAE